MFRSAPPLAANHSDENSTKSGVTHPPSDIQNIVDNKVAKNAQESNNNFAKNPTGNPMPGFSKAFLPSYPGPTTFISQQPARYSYAHGPVARAPAAANNNAQAKPDLAERRDYVVIDIRDFDNYNRKQS
ncbi:hypothetical protein DCAR_0624625 [Daucus carota subsp. sativus]|uniref:Uncharacterized protein n=1 Tax=Daucus carota subsp. sativus TaxID=79200 RepID=A0A164VY51_DAUCS|nr:hypothetical protein DCAR_0624625 [Daucus carota subsp. sativus]